ncbi:nucleotide-binding universal stress UspA family protein [Silvibacterium bohemicum]|uniref:Nucleotide-binding universal stress UspA family protein n=1 Tax=Silvibacterium bohemicum TaxID=1577686 RepID=A0A841K5N8_9BACT|nr:universal stress protein [Silvibacterium bohemicum]MBB6147259.1 nucleotide-binding universal stress UspA family protein [Silvibacterium bohemicum]
MNNTSLKLRTIVVATDLSDPASIALKYAQALARLRQSLLVIVHVIDPLAYAFPEGAPSTLAADKAARQELSRIEEEARDLGIATQSVVENGVVCERILQTIADHHADLLILGTRATTEAGRVALGTVARQLLSKAPCPILAVSPSAESLLPWAGHWRHVLAATDFSPASLVALRYAHRIAHTQLFALHVASNANEHDHSSCMERLRFLAPFNEAHTVPVEHLVSIGEPAKLIGLYANKVHADLIVLGSPANELGEKDFPSSTVLQVVSSATCPVLCVPPLRAAAAEKPIQQVIGGSQNEEVSLQC